MPSKFFQCPDGQKIEIDKCACAGGCRMGQRCSTLPYLRLVGYDREWRGVSPSSAGNGPRQIYLKQVTDYIVDPQDRAFAALGTGVHGKLSLHQYTHNVLSEEQLSDEQMRGISDVLEADEERPGFFILTDYKTWGSFKVGKAIGMVKREVPELSETGNPVFYVKGEKKGQPKMRSVYELDPGKIDMINEELQLNRYRIFFERQGFPISRMQIQCLTRDGGTYIATNRGIEKNVYLIPVKRWSDELVIAFYDQLQEEVKQAFETGDARRCNSWESWEGRRCDGYCEVKAACDAMEARTIRTSLETKGASHGQQSAVLGQA